MRFTKADIEYHAEHFGRFRPAVNVKVRFPHTFYNGELAATVGEHNDEPGFAAWYEQWTETDGPEGEWTFDAACRDGWEQLETDAQEIFGPHVKVYSEGRSGGWAVVHGYSDDTEGWDAIDVSRWGRFARYARLIADDIPYQMLSLLLFNVYEPWRDDQEKMMTGPTLEPVR
jgi:peptidoglycan/xylan/chitin deacetylase (PgdA/CDA1 family)